MSKSSWEAREQAAHEHSHTDHYMKFRSAIERMGYEMHFKAGYDAAMKPDNGIVLVDEIARIVGGAVYGDPDDLSRATKAAYEIAALLGIPVNTGVSDTETGES